MSRFLGSIFLVVCGYTFKGNEQLFVSKFRQGYSEMKTAIIKAMAEDEIQQEIIKEQVEEQPEEVQQDVILETEYIQEVE
jgi:hypothetical protein